MQCRSAAADWKRRAEEKRLAAEPTEDHVADKRIQVQSGFAVRLWTVFWDCRDDRICLCRAIGVESCRHLVPRSSP